MDLQWNFENILTKKISFGLLFSFTRYSEPYLFIGYLEYEKTISNLIICFLGSCERGCALDLNSMLTSYRIIIKRYIICTFNFIRHLRILHFQLYLIKLTFSIFLGKRYLIFMFRFEAVCLDTTDFSRDKPL